MERGHSIDRKFIMQTACALGIADRVDVIDIGSLGLLTRHSAGMITITSTSGLSAIFHGVPLLVIGDALSATDKLSVCGNGQQNLHAFWTCGHPVSAAIRLRFTTWIRDTCSRLEERQISNEFVMTN